MNTSLSIFARALATENISFSFDANAQTAGFDVKNRHLVMPVWKVSETVQTMLVAHEISHALWTPYERSDELFKIAESQGYNIPLLQRITNIIEDVRIEKLMKDKFPGTRRDFFLGYKEIADLDLFGFKKSNLTEAKFLTRLNIHYKWGVFGFIPVQFDAVEQEIVDATDRVKSYEDAFELAKMIYDHPMMKQTVQEIKAAPGAADGGRKPKPGQASQVDKMLEEIAPDSSSLAAHGGNKYVHATVTIPALDDYRKQIITTDDLVDAFNKDIASRRASDLNMDGYRKYVRESESYVRQLVAQFERRKAADTIRKERPKQTGQLNLDRLHQYRTHDDIFLSKIVKQDGKNHGIVFLLDFSGSMATVIDHAYLQVLQLVWFCEKAKIPFEVFGFTDVSYEAIPGYMDEFQEWSRKNPGKWYSDFKCSRTATAIRPVPTGLNYGNARLINLASSRDDAAKRERLLAFMYESMVARCRPAVRALSLHGTPTVESVAIASHFMADWTASNNIQIPTIMVVTDGDPNGVYTNDDSKSKVYHLNDNGRLTVINEVFGTVHSVNAKTDEFGQSPMPNVVIGTMLDSMRQKINARCVGMFVGSRNFSEGLYERYCLSRSEQEAFYARTGSRPTLAGSPRYEAAATMYKEDGCIVMHDSIFPGYDAFFLIRTPQIVKDEDAIAESGTFTKIKNTFIKTMARRGGSRVFLSRYVDIVAGQPLRKMAESIYGQHPWPSNWCPDRK